MELFLDTSDVDAIAELCELYNVAGVTTNPTIVTKSGKPFDQLMAEIVDVLDPSQKLFAQVVSTDFDGIMEEARRITSLRAENTYVKIPVTRIGMRAIKACKAEGLGVLATAIYAPNLGDGIGQVLQLQQMLDVQGVDSKVIAASFKNVQQVNELIAGGIEAVTIPVDVAYNMIDNPSTPIAVDEFTANWEKAYGTTAL